MTHFLPLRAMLGCCHYITLYCGARQRSRGGENEKERESNDINTSQWCYTERVHSLIYSAHA